MVLDTFSLKRESEIFDPVASLGQTELLEVSPYYYSVAVINYPPTNKVVKKYILTYNWGNSPAWWGKHVSWQGREARARNRLKSDHIHTQEPERKNRKCVWL